MKTKISKKAVHAIAASLAPLRDEELTVVAGAGAPEKIHLMLKTGHGAPFILNAVIKP